MEAMKNLCLTEERPSPGEQKLCTLKEEIQSLESPFKWLRLSERKDKFSHVASDFLLERCAVEDDDEPFHKYTKFMHLVYETAVSENAATLWEKMHKWKELFVDSVNKPFFQKHYEVLQHVIYSTQAYLFFEAKEYEKASSLVDQIKEIDLESDSSKAAIYGLQAEFFDQYGIEGHKRGLPLAQKAMTIDDKEPAWIYITGKTKRDIRRTYLRNTGNEEQLLEELKLFEYLTGLDKQPVYLIKHGHAFLDLAVHYWQGHKETKRETKCSPFNCGDCKKIDGLCYKGVELFKEALYISQRNCSSLRNVLRGIKSIPKLYLTKDNRKFAEECARSLENINCTKKDKKRSIYSCLGKFYQHIKNNQVKAQEFFKEAAELGSLSSEKEVIILRYRSGENDNPCEDIIKRLEKYKDVPRTVDSFSQIAYYYLSKNNLVETIKAMELVIKADPELSSPTLTNFKSWFNFKMSSINLVENILRKVLIRLMGRHRENKAILFGFANEIKKRDPKLYEKVNGKP